MVTIESFSRLAVTGMALMLTACASGRGGDIPYEVADFGPPDGPQVVAADAVYRLAPLDTLNVLVFGVPELSAEYQIDQSGAVTLPLVGRVDAVGLTSAELAQRVEEGLSQRYLRNPNVTISVKESVSRVVTIDGAVRRPGVYPITGNALTLVQAIASAQGIDEMGNARRVAIFRTIDGQQVASAFDLVSIRRGEAQNPVLYPGDTIIVDGSGLRQVQRELLQSLPLASTIFFALRP